MSYIPEIILDSLQLYEKAVIENVKNEGNTVNKDKGQPEQYRDSEEIGTQQYFQPDYVYMDVLKRNGRCKV